MSLNTAFVLPVMQANNDTLAETRLENNLEHDKRDTSATTVPPLKLALGPSISQPVAKNQESSSDDSDSSSGDESSSGDSSSSGSNSSSSSDSEDENSEKSKTPAPGPAGPTTDLKVKDSDNSGKKIIAAGSVINTIRVVPIKEPKKYKRTPSAKYLEKLQRQKENTKSDPTFQAPQHVKINTSKSASKLDISGALNGHCGSGNSTTTGGSTSNEAKRELRSRDNAPVLNEDYIFKLQDIMFKETLAKKGKGSKATGKGRSAKGKKDLNVGSGKDLGSDTPPSFLRASGRTVDWDPYLNNMKNPDNLKWIASVSHFRHAPMNTIWSDIAKVGTKIEIPNPYVPCNRPVYWLATIRFFAGYKALVEYESFGYGVPHFAWISFCSSVPKPIGYCDDNRILLFPPHHIYEQNKDFLTILRSVVHEYSTTTVRKDHIEIIAREIKSKYKYQLMDPVEVMDYTYTHLRRIGKITGIIGDRVHVTYNDKKEDHGFWFNVQSEGVNKIGWSQTIGCELVGVPKNASLPLLDASTFPPYPKNLVLKTGMVFEVIHPLHLHIIAVGCVEQVYNFGYFLAKIECNAPLADTTRFIFHITSPWILPCGFCSRNEIQLAVPYGETEGFNWNQYCNKKHLKQLDLTPILPRSPNKFTTGAKMEAIDLRQPTFCGPATVIKVAEHLMLLHFDGWNRDTLEALQWVDYESHNIYPAGWAELVGHEYFSTPDPPNPIDFPVSLICK